MITRIKIKSTVLLLIVLFLSGCAFFQPHPKISHWEKNRIKLQQIRAWSLKGAFSITSNNKREIARFTWVKNLDSYTIDVFGPMNVDGARIIGNAKWVEFWQTDKKPLKAKTAEQLLFSQLGWQFPVSNVRYWILGIPNPDEGVETTYFDQAGHLVELKQNNWEVKFSRFWYDSRMQVDLPQIIELKQGAIYIKLKITAAAFS